MLFHSQTFVVGFLPPVVLLYYLLGHDRVVRQTILIVSSIVFYAWWDVRLIPLLVGLAVATWVISRLYHLSVAPGAKVGLIAAGIALNLGALIVFKYADFIGKSFSALFGQEWAPMGLVLPLGISFFVFQKLSYLIDLKRGDRHAYSFLDFSLFVSFFPQLIAGPLVRHNEIIDQFHADPRGSQMWANLSRGAVLFTIGMAKKLALADTLSPNADRLFALAGHAPPNAAEGWAAAAIYALQIYFDFSGYSDMAIGLALMFGLRLPVNFNAPYRSASIREFWRRWHMTLSRFLRDYLYIPLGGSRRGALRQVVNVIATMLLGGLWHGANWTFVAWGGLHGAALALNGAWVGVSRPPKAQVPSMAGRAFGWLLTMVFVVISWVLFRSPDFPTAWRMFSGMVGAGGWRPVSLKDGWVLPLGAAIAIIGPTSQQVTDTLLQPRAWMAVPAGVALVALLLLSGGRLHDAFIYFQF